VVPHQHDGKDYYFEDEGISAGRKYFYRLKIVNAGHFEYSHVEMVNLNVENTQQIQVFPNPFRDQLIIRTGGAIRHIKIFDMHGREIMQRSNAVTGSHEMKFALKSYPSGMYLIQITDRNGNVG